MDVGVGFGVGLVLGMCLGLSLGVGLILGLVLVMSRGMDVDFGLGPLLSVDPRVVAWVCTRVGYGCGSVSGYGRGF